MKYYNHLLLSDNFKDFLISQKDEYSSHLIRCFIDLCLYDFSLKSLNEALMDKIYKRIFDKIYNISDSDNGYIIINDNQCLKLGRFISRIAKELNITITKQDNIEIEKFIDLYKSWYKSINTFQFKILKGEQILKGYNKIYYARDTGSLGSSCMNNKFPLLDLYVENEDKVNLLVLYDSKDRIHGRSLLWNLDNKPYQFMDRVYGSDGYVPNMFKNYAIQHKFAYREQDIVNNFKIYLPGGTNSYSNEILFKTNINVSDIKFMPYMDSLYIWNKWDKVLSNKTGRNGVFKSLRDTRGGTNGTELKLLGVKLKSFY